MSELRHLTEGLLAGRALGVAEASAAAKAMVMPEVADNDKAGFLRALGLDGANAQVALTEFAKVFRGLAREPGVGKWAAKAVDVCGTGGDHSGSFNVSTTVAFVVAAAGVPMFKHGNRSITSRSGSADFLKAVGIPMEASDDVWRESLEQLNFAFFFAPAYHPAFKYVGPARKILADEKRPTIFNLLGPLLNPGRPAMQLAGVFSSNLTGIVAQALTGLGSRRGLVVHCQLPGGKGLDELAVVGDNVLAGAGYLTGMTMELSAKDAGLSHAPVSDLAGGGVEENMELLDALLIGRAPAGLRDTVCLNAGVALCLIHSAKKIGIEDIRSATQEARRLLEGGAVKDWLAKAKAFFATVKNKIGDRVIF